ncbi:MAG TPA: winged helix-turn-helix domain-containing protein [Pyrinomonadaceae bacterium]|jgi:DNA-binding winged helix-turn-helix (wHTH) protein/Tfp pilus assembly protein PilF
MSSNHQYSYKFKDFRLDVAERRLLRDETSVPLMPKMFDVLAMLVERGGHLVEKEELLRAVWEDAFVEESNVARVVHSLRKILGESSADKFIETVPKKGYRFVAEVEKVNAGAEPATRDFFAPRRDERINYILQTGDDLIRKGELPEKSEGAEDVVSPARAARGNSGYLAALAIAALLATGALVYKFLPAAKPSGSPPPNKSIAVLPVKPLQNQNGDSLYELGIAESLILKLSAGKHLTVRPLSATRKYLELEQNPTDAGREQQVDYVLSSNYQIANGVIRVTAQLINTENGTVEEIFKSEEDSANVFSMQDAIADDIGEALLARFGAGKGKSNARRGTSNEEAYRLYLQAAFIFDQWNKTEIGKAIGFLERAVELDPDYAAAHTMLAYAYRYFSHKDLAPREQQFKANQAIGKALALDPESPDARAVLGLLKFSYENDFAGAEKEFRQAVALDPDAPMPRALYAYFLMSRGRFDEAIAENKKAMEIDPASYAHQITYGMILYYAHRFREAEAHYRKLLDRDRNFAYAYFWMWLLADLQGDEARAFDWFMQHQTQIKAAPEVVQAYQAAYRRTGWKGILRENIERDEKRLVTDDYAGLYYEIACFSARLGDREKALANLDKAYRASSSSILFIKVDPYLDSLHGDPRFETLADRIQTN